MLIGRCLPYGEGVTYWPLAEMVKASSGISDDDPLDDAQTKLRACCEDEAVADLLGLAVGVLEAVEGERSAAGDRLGRARLGGAARAGAAARARLRGRALGRGAAARADRAPRLVRARGAACSCSRSRGPSCSTCARPGAAGACARRRSSSSRCRPRRARSSSRRSPPQLDLPLDIETRAREDRRQPALRRGDGAHARRAAARGRPRAHPRHAPGSHRRAHRPPARRAAARAPARVRDGPHLHGRRARAHLAGDRRRRPLHRGAAAARPHRARDARDDSRRAGLQVQARADPRGRLLGAREERARRSAPRVRRVARTTAPATSCSRSARSISTRRRRSSQSSTAPRRPSCARRRRSR